MQDLEPRFQEPAGWETSTFTNADGAKLHYGHALPKNTPPRATVVIGPGFAEFTEKFFEVAQYYLDMGCEVYALDWRGQGRSQRYLADPRKPYSLGFDHDVNDLDQFVREIVKPGKSRPLIMSMQSMGAHIGLRYLHDHPGVFKAAVLSTPMLDIQTGSISYILARMIANGGYFTGQDQRYIPGGLDTHGNLPALEQDPKSRDEIRRRVQSQWIKKDPALDLGDPTIGWIYQVFRSVDIVAAPGYLEAIKTPILLGIAMQDSVVSNQALEAAAKRLPNVRAVRLDDCRHEIWMERDICRKIWTGEVENFLKPFFPKIHMKPQAGRKPRPAAPRP